MNSATQVVPAQTASDFTRNDWQWWFVRGKYWAWTVITKAIVGLTYLAVISQGLRNVFPEMGFKLSKIPGLWFLSYFKSTYRLDLAWGAALLPLTLTFILWFFILKMNLTPAKFAKLFPDSDPEGWKTAFGILGTVIIVADGCLFYSCFVHGGWGKTSFISVAGLIAVAAYIAVLVAINLVSLFLHEQIPSPKED